MDGYVVEWPGHLNKVICGDRLESVAVGRSVLAAFTHNVLECLKLGYSVVVVNHRKPWYDNQNYDGKNQQELC